MQKHKEMVQRELAHSGPFFYAFIGRQPVSEMQPHSGGIELACLIAFTTLLHFPQFCATIILYPIFRKELE